MINLIYNFISEIQRLLTLASKLFMINTNQQKFTNSQGICQSASQFILQQKQYTNQPINLTFQNIFYSTKTKMQNKRFCYPFLNYQQKSIINDVSGIFRQGQITAIMGQSGCGKTTLLNLLAKKIQPDSGAFKANGFQYDFKSFGNYSSYVMQNDYLYHTFTIRQTLQFAADLKYSDKNLKKQILFQVIQKFKLYNCLNSIIGDNQIKGASGGQKKRTSIAFQMISDPQIMLLDQPTSGLDSLTSYIIIKYLYDNCVQRNKTVIMSIHQPNPQIFGLFHNLLLMIQGNIIYQGKTQDALNYFEQIGFKVPQFMNPADYYLSIMHKETQENSKNIPLFVENYNLKIKPLIEQDIKKISNQSFKNLPIKRQGASTCTSIKVLFKREFLNVLRNPLVFKSRIFQIVLMGIFIGGVFFNASS